jgi:hypothetical protein
MMRSTQSTMQVTRPARLEPAQAATPRFAVRWSVSPLAAVDAGLTPAPHAEVCLELDIVEDEEQAARVEAWLVCNGKRQMVLIEGTPRGELFRDSSGLVHFDAPGFASLTWSEDAASGPRVVYAKTDLLARLGLAGGRYELED